ncbi:MAG: 3'(2'),5'-bisphosphate nucleotidase CysQ [Cytophagaceae bacterium]
MKYSIEAIEAAAIQASLEAGKKIMEVYARPDFTELVEFKDDRSPLTLADKKSHEVIASILSSSFPDIPMISEEGKDISYNDRKDWECYWLVDPLDGTKEFIKRNGEFTVNIALMVNKKPVVGIIFIPVQNKLYVGVKDKYAYKIENETKQTIQVRTAPFHNRIAVGSRSHSAPEEKAVFEKYGIEEMISSGSSIKFCLVADGSADLYYRHGPTMEWDTAAGQAIVEAAGGTMTMPDGTSFPYNKENLLNSGFLVKGNI